MQGLLSLEVDSGAVAWVLEYLRALRHGRLLPYNYVERKTRLATRGSTTWGPTGEQLRELAAASHQSECLDALFAVLSQRLGARTSSSWRKVYKSLLVLEFLVTRGSQAAAMRGKDVRHLVRDLCDFEFTDPATGKDEVRLCCCAVCSKRERLTHVPTQGVNVRERAKKVHALLTDDARLRAERETQRKQYWCVFPPCALHRCRP